MGTLLAVVHNAPGRPPAGRCAHGSHYCASTHMRSISSRFPSGYCLTPANWIQSTFASSANCRLMAASRMWNFPRRVDHRAALPPTHSCPEKSVSIRGYHAELDGASSLASASPASVFVGLASQKDGGGPAASRKAPAAGPRCASATCCRARWISSPNASPPTCRGLLTEFHYHRRADRREERRQRESSLVIHASKQMPGYPIEVPVDAFGAATAARGNALGFPSDFTKR